MSSIISFIKNRLIFITSLLVIISACYYFFWPTATGPGETPMVVEAETIVKGDLSKSVKLLAHVSSKQETTFLSHIKGRLKSIYVEEGKAVKKGTLLAELDNEELLREMSHATTKVKLAQDQFDRLSQLQKSNAQSQANLDRAHEALLREQIAREHVEDRLSKTQFFAPFDGVCGVFRIRPGQTVKDGDVIVSCYDASGFSLNIDVPETLIASVEPGQAIRLKDAESKLLSVQKSIDPNTHMALARAEVPGTWPVSSGQLVSIEVDVETRKDIISVPKGAIFIKDNNSFVYTIVDGKANLQSVTAGLEGKNRMEVTEGLNAGDKIILKGQENIWPTRAVKELTPETKPVEKPKE